MLGGLHTEEAPPSSQEDVTMPSLPVSTSFNFNTTVVDDIAFHDIGTLGYLS